MERQFIPLGRRAMLRLARSSAKRSKLPLQSREPYSPFGTRPAQSRHSSQMQRMTGFTPWRPVHSVWPQSRPACATRWHEEFAPIGPCIHSRIQLGTASVLRRAMGQTESLLLKFWVCYRLHGLHNIHKESRTISCLCDMGAI